MLTSPIRLADGFFAELREREFARLDENGIAYLDHGGSAPHAASHVAAHRELLARAVLGNPHSEHAASQASSRAIDAARRRVLRFLDAGDDYVVCFTANASTAIKLVAEAYPFSRASVCVLSADNHNSVNGIREYARRAGASVDYLPLREDLRLDDPEARLAAAGGPGLFAFPAQSNFSGLQHPLSLVRTARSLGFHVLLDAAAFVPAHALSLRRCPADFVAVSFYKIFGYPTGIGALVARREALDALARPWFAGGTVEHVSVQPPRHRLRHLHEGFEDGTPDFIGISALEDGFSLMDRIGLDRLACHVADLAAELVERVTSLRRGNGWPLVKIYGATGEPAGTVTFNVLDADGRCVPFGEVEARASAEGVHVRGGCFCNPGAAETAFRSDGAIGAVRASIGLANNRRDIARAVDVIASFA
ncbi:MAG TPA: aminotransferase class V-fold PLP-dependent enzyme [Vicinamibacterales bacterium]|jgi:selenocysteine lyase/cysteine desulfurase|nr:aminotransferase class V-fold PLP-dependent enzyme [Vicinamibacterales bacterium]